MTILLVTTQLKYTIEKSRILSNAQTFYKGRSDILIAFEENIFPLPKPYNFGINEWKEKDLYRKEFMPKYFFKKSFLEKHDHKNSLLERDFQYKNIDELMNAFDNTETDEELDELFDKIDNKLTTLKKLVRIVSNTTEKKRINNVIKSIDFVLDYF